jgi:hypothetical protein
MPMKKLLILVLVAVVIMVIAKCMNVEVHKTDE